MLLVMVTLVWTVLIKRHDIIYDFDGKQLDTPLKLTITTFQVKDALLQAEKHSIILLLFYLFII